MPPVLLSRGLDPLLGVFTGVLAYYLYETHPSNGISGRPKADGARTMEDGQVEAGEARQREQCRQ
ncbi:uncharacterized protein EV420DRAFT_1116329 [Desarmillaria tabescens]|uniref:Uncharacterized protein n=1 Tax=Armillaria tabescens TaxID=1929756 RepID=A0AA39NE25_ARMTA|nr:uncharacterized protein EV420DRAFT_1116329 [Desarmillaria tabescens]KAK0463945.1 hypothetical protein EV420DRAFT_1116329 [Desarmillaria tabescens]